MRKGVFGAVLLALAGLTAAQSADIEGAIVIKRKLTRRKVTPAASSYQRGVAVELAADTEDDPLSFERARVAIYLEGELPSSPTTATMDQQNRRFVPDTLVIPAGSTVSFPNLDPIFHNVFSLSRPASFDLGNYSKEQTRTVTFAKPGIVFVGCHLHPNMGAVIVVSPNGWSAKADRKGQFTLAHVPPGAYTIVAWHKAAGFFRQRIQVREDRAAGVQFVIPLDESGGGQKMAARR
jgi:plastocyanin